MEDKADEYRVLASIAPLARSAMDKNGQQALNKHAKNVFANIKAMTPWRKSSSLSGLREQLSRKDVNSGEIVVMLDAGDNPEDPLFEGVRKVQG